MKRLILFLLCITLFLSACSPVNTESDPSNEPLESSAQQNKAVEETNNVYIPAHPLTMEETIQQFFEQQYNAYTSLQYIDISYLLDMDQNRFRNALTWLENLIQRRRLISENNFCYVDTNKYPYTINYEEEAQDRRMDFYREKGIHNEEEELVHFTITGEKEKTYPPFMAVNGQHTMRLKQVDGIWKITFHYYPGSSRLRTKTPLAVLSKEEILSDLREEFKELSQETIDPMQIPANAFRYSGSRAVKYARTYIASPNPAFYDIEDWVGNCANFTSQSLWYGFGSDDRVSPGRENMTTKWYAGGGGGSPAWENVEVFWNYVTAPPGTRESGIHGEVVETISGLDIGGIVQTRPGRFRDTDERFSHNLLLVDKSTLLLAQNTPDSYIYYSDLADVDTRFFNPRYLIE